MITAPQLFRAQDVGFVDIGDVYTYAPDVPFTSEVVNRAWAAANQATVKKYLTAYGKAIAWFDDPKNRAEAIDILLKASKMNQDDIAKSYDLLRKINYFDKSDMVSMKTMENYVKAQERVDGPIKIDLNKLVLEIK
jgi:ABC-type nitrate/sulfonate/bicarbonate transport system substrate-binding protein